MMRIVHMRADGRGDDEDGGVQHAGAHVQGGGPPHGLPRLDQGDLCYVTEIFQKLHSLSTTARDYCYTSSMTLQLPVQLSAASLLHGSPAACRSTLPLCEDRFHTPSCVSVVSKKDTRPCGSPTVQNIPAFLKSFSGEVDISESLDPVKSFKTFNEVHGLPGNRPCICSPIQICSASHSGAGLVPCEFATLACKALG